MLVIFAVRYVDSVCTEVNIVLGDSFFTFMVVLDWRATTWWLFIVTHITFKVNMPNVVMSEFPFYKLADSELRKIIYNDM